MSCNRYIMYGTLTLRTPPHLIRTINILYVCQFCIIACQSLIGRMSTVVQNEPRHTDPTHSDVQEHPEWIHSFCLQTLVSKYCHVLVYPAVELELIINSASYNIGSWQPPKSLSQHQRSSVCSTMFSSAESQNYTFDPVFFNSSKKHHSKVDPQQLWLERHVLKW